MNLIIRPNRAYTKTNAWRPIFRQPSAPQSNTREHFNVPMNIIDTKDVYKVELSVPGWKREEIELLLDNDTLIIEGKKPSSKEDRTGHSYFKNEFKRIDFRRSIGLGKLIDTETIKAQLEQGILTIELTKINPSSQQERRKINVA